MRLIIFTIILTSLTSCINKKLIHGNLPSADLVSIIKLGKDNKESISKILGEPSFQGTLGDNSFYYLGRVNSQIAFLKPDLEQQIILELNFDKKDKLKKIFVYDEKQTINIAMSPKETQLAGYKQSLLRQILGNFGMPGMKRGGPIIGSGRAEN
ncbi:MAG: hypothetical protein CMP34_04870 [Rickettsiales bacterium]|nr:hypothetical protein [Rickettsiales bacterium]|tara:strand:- start:2119 stop:2580 length:462 start_codon:yes stop_codon:yes gene_type:complete